MLRAVGSLIFYARFFRQFSRLGFDRRSASFDPAPISLTGQTWLVTGASGGIGLAIAKGAAAAGAHVLLAARDRRKLETAAAAMPGAAVHSVDFSSLASTRSFAAEIECAGPIDVLVNNVGVLLNQHALTSEGFEASFVSNLLSHFVLTESLRRQGTLRGAVINMSSGGMYGVAPVIDGLNRTDPASYDGMAAYAAHKRAQVELTAAWNARWAGQPRAYVMHPGWVDTDGVRTALPWFRATLRRYLRNAEQGADTALWLGATRPDTQRGIWLDRVLDDEHAFAFTRPTSDVSAALYDYLKHCAGQ
jgi:dehydrogenase/reductase SDR family protein 12